jgi:CheY-like chemotaxis protein
MFAPRRSPTSLAPTRVLVIGYDTDVRNLFCEMLKEEGYQVLASDHPVSPLNVQQLWPSLAVPDVILGGRPDGYGWLEAVRAWPGTARLPALVCSGYLAPTPPVTDRMRALADATMPKPYALNEFLDAVPTAWRRKRLEANEGWAASNAFRGGVRATGR